MSGPVRVSGVVVCAAMAASMLAAAPAQAQTATAGQLIISEFRLRGIGGDTDEFIEIYNNTNSPHIVTAASGGGYGVAASDGITRCTIPNGTVIPARGHFLCVNSGGYALGAQATGDATYTTDITDGEDPDGPLGNPALPRQGIAIFNNNSGGGSYSLANRLDAVGSTAEGNTVYREGAGLPTFIASFNINYSWVRDECGKGGAVNLLGPCTISTPKDTDNNAADFYFVDTNGTSIGGGQRLGAPGPENLASPINRNSSIATNLLDATLSSSAAPNRVRDFTSGPNATFGTLTIRRRFTNNTGAPVTRLRFRIIDLDTFPAASGFADLRPATSTLVVVSNILDPATCAPVFTPPCLATVEGTTLEQAGGTSNQPNGGGFNSTLSIGGITLASPLASGASLNVQFLLGIQQTGNFRIYLNIEALP